MLDRFEFLIGEAFVALRRNTLMTAAAITTSAVALFLLGGLGYLYFRASSTLADASGKFEMRVYIRDGSSMDTIKETAARLRKIDGVRSVNWIPKDKAWERFRKQNPSITEGIDNPFPDGFKVIVEDVALTRKIGSQIQSMAVTLPSPDGVVFQEDEERLLNELLELARWIGGGLGIVLFVTAGVLIYNAIRLTVDARRREIRIMQLVGATSLTIRTPFVIEGVIQGMVGGILAAFLIQIANGALQDYVRTQLSSTWQFPEFPVGAMVLSLGLVGAVFGLVCSGFSVRGPLKVALKGAQ